MNKIKQQFSDLRKSTPKYVQWLLLAVAFLVVLILLTLLMTGTKSKSKTVAKNDVPVKITLSNDTINWSDVMVGAKVDETVIVQTNAPARATVRRNKEISGFNVKTTCTDNSEITASIPCRVILEYAPTVAMKPETINVFVDWRASNEPESMKSAEKITVVLGANAPEIKPTTKPIVTQEPVAAPEPIITPAPVAKPSTEIKSEIESIAPSNLFANEKKAPTPTIEPAPTPRASESCSDFAFPGYDSNGVQIGWIKPERGAYYFHPFSDKDCKNATGIYNPASGIITDINGGGNRIGTDAEHIGRAIVSGAALPALNDAPNTRRATVQTTDIVDIPSGGMAKIVQKQPNADVTFGTTDTNAIIATQPYDRTFILRQYKPIPATIVSDVRADTALESGDANLHFPVRATVDRNVYSDNGRTVIIPTGTLMLGYVTGNVPGPYKAIGRMNIKWYQFVLPNGVEFNFQNGTEPSSADAQGRIGVPGRGSTDYLEQFVMPMLTSIVPAAVNMIAPVADKFVNQIDLDNNTVVQSGTMRSSELAKNEIITAWNQVAQKLLVDMMDNTVPPFSIPAGTRITVYSPYDLMVACTDENKKCYMNGAAQMANNTRSVPKWDAYATYDDGTWVGQARSFNLSQYCTTDSKTGALTAMPYSPTIAEALNNLGYSYSTLLAYCQSSNYQAINIARQEAIYQNQQSTSNKNSVASTGGVGTQTYNEQVLGLKYNEDGSIKNPYQSESKPADAAPAANVITCEDGAAPDANGCCAGEIYTDMGEQGFNCCPQTGGDCFPPIL